MKLYLKQRLISWFDSYNIYDEKDNIIYVVKGELSWGHQLRIYNKNNKEVGLIKEKVFRILPKFTLYDNKDNEIGMVCRELTLFKPRYTLTSNDWTINGDFLGWNYEVVDGKGETVIKVKKKIFHLTDQYEIDVTDSNNSLLALEIVLSIDIDMCNSNSNI